MSRKVCAPNVVIGQMFGKRKVMSDPVFIASGPRGKKRWYVSVLCQCGVQSDVLVQNIVKSSTCGCDLEPQKAKVTTHGMSRHWLYVRWRGMMTRCYLVTHSKYARYGGRGIRVCAEWHTFETFRDWAFACEMSKEMEIDRINNDGEYSPHNCRVVTHMRNQQNKNVTCILTINGEKKSAADWSRDPRCKAKYVTILARLRYGWSHERAVFTAPLWKR